MRFVMCPPKYLSVKIKNNVHMKKAQKVDVPRALTQWGRLANICKALGVEVEEIPAVKGNQDQVFTANVAIAIEPYVVLAKYRAAGRSGEVEPARKFFEVLGYETVQPPYFFEGEADLKKLNETTYFGGWGQFSDWKAHQWISEKTGVTILPIKEISKETYHLDCCLSVIDKKNVIVTHDTIDKTSLRIIERAANVIMTPKGIDKTTGATNGVLIPDKKIYLSGALYPERPEYRKTMEWMQSTLDKFGISCMFLDCDSFEPSGADLSCLICHLDFLPKDVDAAVKP